MRIKTPTERQRRFAEEYVIDLNGTQAAIRAGYAPKQAACQAWRLLAQPVVRELVAEGIRRRSEKTEITQERVLRELAAIAFANGTDYVQVSDEGRVEIAPTSALSEQQKAAVVAIKEGSKGGIEIKLADKTKALSLLGRHLGMFAGREEQEQEEVEEIREEVFSDD